MSSTPLLRKSTQHADSKVVYAELFFDLVFVFAITQISHFLIQNLSLIGLLQAGFLTLAVWWVWIYTAWATNWVDPQQTTVRLMLFALMLAGLVLSVSLPRSFLDRSAEFAYAYTLMQLARSAFMIWSFRATTDGRYRNAIRIFIWLSFSSLFWLIGAHQAMPARVVYWGMALSIEYLSPMLGFWVPSLGRSLTSDWSISGAHLAERCGLFMIIALGEGLLVTGATFSKLIWSPVTTTAFVIAFLNSVAMWWIYFNVGAECAAEKIAKADDPGELGRVAYTYLHILILAGVIMTDVGDELILAHPQHLSLGLGSWLIVGGPFVFLLGNLLFKWVVFERFARSHVVGLLSLALLYSFSTSVPQRLLGAVALLILTAVAVSEHWVLRDDHCP